MATISLYYDKNKQKVTLNISHLGEHYRRFLPISIAPNQWDKKSHSVINHPQRKELNIYLQSILAKSQTELLKMQESVHLRSLSANDIRDKVCEVVLQEDKDAKQAHTLLSVFQEMEQCKLSDKSKHRYRYTFNHIRKYDKCADKLKLEDITRKWIEGFEKSMVEDVPSPNSRALYIQCLSAAIRYALEHEYTTTNGLIGYRPIKKVPTKKRDLSVDVLRKVLDYPADTIRKRRAVDMFRLMFFLRGINYKDLSLLTQDNIHNGRIEYIRAKTGKEYSIKIEKEAQEILDKYKGEKKLICLFDKTRTHCSYTYTTKSLHAIEKELGLKELTTYYSRHSWATIAFNDIGVPIEVISIGLGHTYGSNTTGTYINKNNRLADKANRLVMDYVLYDKKEKWEW